MIKVNGAIYRLFAGLTANQYLIVGQEGLTLVDTGLPGSEHLIFARLKDLGFAVSDLKYILITHADPDHAGALWALKRASRARVYASRVEAQGLRRAAMTRAIQATTMEGRIFNAVLPLFHVRPAEVDEIVQAGYELPVLGNLQVLETPGHTPGHLSYFAPAERILFSGDSIKILGNRLGPYQGDSTWNKAIARRSFEQQMALNPAMICGGHGFYPLWY